MDVTTASLNSEIDEKIYMKIQNFTKTMAELIAKNYGRLNRNAKKLLKDLKNKENTSNHFI